MKIMRSTISGQRDPILYSLGRINYLRTALKEKEEMEEKLQLVDVIQKEVISSLYVPCEHIKHQPLKYNLEAKIDRVESTLRGMEICLTGQKTTVQQKRMKMLDSFCILKAEIRKQYM